MPDDEKLITTAQLAERLGVNARTIQLWAAAGKITPTVRTPGGRARWSWESVKAQLRDTSTVDQSDD